MLNGEVFKHKVDAGPAAGMIFIVRLPEDSEVSVDTLNVINNYGRVHDLWLCHFINDLMKYFHAE